jgi:hypothetical protein
LSCYEYRFWSWAYTDDRTGNPCELFPYRRWTRWW